MAWNKLKVKVRKLLQERFNFKKSRLKNNFKRLFLCYEILLSLIT